MKTIKIGRGTNNDVVINDSVVSTSHAIITVSDFGEISIEDFFRLSSMLERIPYVDLAKLELYNQDFYDDEGDSELLFAFLLSSALSPNKDYCHSA